MAENESPHLNEVAEVPRLSFMRKLGYGVGDVGPALSVTIRGFYLNAFLLDVAGLSPALAGIIFLIVEIWNGFNDPLFGTLTDRTKSRWGRRRPWLLFGAVPFGLAWFLQWQLPAMNEVGLFIYYLLVALLLDTALTAVNVPYTALTPEIAPDYDERTSLNSFRFSFSILGGMIALLVHDTIINASANVVTGYTISALIMGIVIVASNWITFAATQERYSPQKAEQQPGFFAGFVIAFRNRPFLMVTGIYLISWLAIQFVQVNMLLYVRYWMKAEEQFIIIAMTLQLSIFVFLIIWTKISERIGKRQVYFVGVSFWIFIELVLFFVQPGQMTFLITLAVLAGAGASVGYLTPWSMLPDVVDVDELETGWRREGVYYGFFVFLQKMGLAAGLFISNQIFDILGYVNAQPGQPFPTQPDEVQLALRLFVSVVPAILLLISFPIVYKYPITRERHAEIRAQLAMRKNHSS